MALVCICCEVQAWQDHFPVTLWQRKSVPVCHSNSKKKSKKKQKCFLETGTPAEQFSLASVRCSLLGARSALLKLNSTGCPCCSLITGLEEYYCTHENKVLCGSRGSRASFDYLSQCWLGLKTLENEKNVELLQATLATTSVTHPNLRLNCFCELHCG